VAIALGTRRDARTPKDFTEHLTLARVGRDDANSGIVCLGTPNQPGKPQ